MTTITNLKSIKSIVNTMGKNVKKYEDRYNKINNAGCQCSSYCNNKDHMLCYRNKDDLLEALGLEDSDFMYATPKNISMFRSGKHPNIFKGVTLWGHGHFILNWEETEYFKRLKVIKNSYKRGKQLLKRQIFDINNIGY